MNPNTETSTTPAEKHDAADYFHPGSIAERVDTQLGVLTQGVVECMILATGNFPDLTEGPPAEPDARIKVKPMTLSSWQAARSAELRDAARLTDASARLLAGFAKLRGQFSQDFTIRHSDRQGANAKKRQRNTTITHSFSVPGKQALAVEDAGDESAADLTRELRKIAERLAQDVRKNGDGVESPLEMLKRKLDLPPEPAPDASSEEPPPSPGT